MVDVRDHGHVPDVLLLVHAFPHLVGCEVDLQFNLDHKQITIGNSKGCQLKSFNSTINIAFSVCILYPTKSPS